MDVAYWQTAFSAALARTQRWAAEHARSETLLSVLVDFHSRIGLLKQTGDGALAVLERVPDAVPRLRAKHLRGFENLLVELRGCTSKLEAIQADIAEIKGNQAPTSSWARCLGCRCRYANGLRDVLTLSRRIPMSGAPPRPCTA